MKKFLLGIILLAFAMIFPVPAMAGVDISIGISLPPPVVFAAPPEVIVLPDTPDVYVVPDIDVDLFFWNGWWWRLWEGRWYRSHYYNRGWAYYDYVPNFYFDVDPGWRGYYRERDWHGHPWNYQRIPDQRLERNWKSWHNNRYWEKRASWGVQDYRPRPKQERQELRQERQRQYNQMPEVQRHKQQRQEQPKRYQQRQDQSRQYQQKQEQPKRSQQRQEQPKQFQQKQRQQGQPEVRQPQGQQSRQRQERQPGAREQKKQQNRDRDEQHKGRSPREGVGG